MVTSVKLAAAPVQAALTAGELAVYLSEGDFYNERLAMHFFQSPGALPAI